MLSNGSSIVLTAVIRWGPDIASALGKLPALSHCSLPIQNRLVSFGRWGCPALLHSPLTQFPTYLLPISVLLAILHSAAAIYTEPPRTDVRHLLLLLLLLLDICNTFPKCKQLPQLDTSHQKQGEDGKSHLRHWWGWRWQSTSHVKGSTAASARHTSSPVGGEKDGEDQQEAARAVDCRRSKGTEMGGGRQEGHEDYAVVVNAGRLLNAWVAHPWRRGAATAITSRTSCN